MFHFWTGSLLPMRLVAADAGFFGTFLAAMVGLLHDELVKTK